MKKDNEAFMQHLDTIRPTHVEIKKTVHALRMMSNKLFNSMLLLVDSWEEANDPTREQTQLRENYCQNAAFLSAAADRLERLHKGA